MADYGTLLRDHVALNCRSLDRIFLQAYVPKLQSVGQVCTFLRWHKGFPIPSSAAFGKLGQAYVESIEHFAEAEGVPIIRFEKGQNKEAIAQPYIDEAAKQGGDGRVALIGIAQEKASAWRSWKAKGQENAAHPHMEWGRQMVYVNHYYFYLWDPEWGGAFWKTNAYAPYPIWLWLNGHEWAKRQLTKKGIGYQALDNGFRSCDEPGVLQEICDSLGPECVKEFFWRWFRRLPSPLSMEDVQAGYTYDAAFRQIEISETLVFDRPQVGRAWFEAVIRDHLDVGRPEKVVLLFDRRLTSRTPGSFRTQVITKGVDPILSCYYKSSRVKQYFKEGRALRTETVICDTKDFGIGRSICEKNWNALRAVGEDANRRLLNAESADAMPIPDVATFERVTQPSTNDDGFYSSGLRFGDPRVMAVLAAILAFCFVTGGFTNRQLVERVSALLDAPYSVRQASYDLRRLRRKRLIDKIPKKHRYQLTPDGRRVAALFTKAYGRIIAPGLTALDLRLPEDIRPRAPVALAWRRFDKELEALLRSALTAAA